MKKFEEIEHHYDELKVLWLNYWKEEVIFTFLRIRYTHINEIRNFVLLMFE